MGCGVDRTALLDHLITLRAGRHTPTFARASSAKIYFSSSIVTATAPIADGRTMLPSTPRAKRISGL
jgi:hypothetical protein